MRSMSFVAAPVLIVGVVLALGAAGGFSHAAEEAPTRAQVTYESHYLVFGTRDASGSPRLLAIDFNRTKHGPGRIAYEYKLFVMRDGDWSMPVYETWEVDGVPSARFPERGGLAPEVSEYGRLRRIQTDLSGLSLTIRSERSSFPFPKKDRSSDSRTAHPHFTVRWNGTTYQGPGVYEWIRADPSGAQSPSEEIAEEKRRLDEEASFGLYDWIVLYDDKGRLWHVSQGTLSRDFAYQQASSTIPAQTRDVLVRWLATEPDRTAEMHTPTKWLVDVPAWAMRVQLRKTGEHRGHGSPRSDGTRPIYVQASVEGWGLIQGEKHQFFGMVEHIRD